MSSRDVELDADRAAWRAARTFDDLCRLGAAFIEGRCRFFPGWGSPFLDDESDEIAAHLTALQRAGVLTLASQPGSAPRASHDGALHEQRAFVCGFASESAARAIVAGRFASDLAIATFRRGDRDHEAIAVSRRGGVAHAFAGHSAFEAELACFRGTISRAAFCELERSTYVSAIDLEWGRDSRLWSELARALDSPRASDAQ